MEYIMKTPPDDTNPNSALPHGYMWVDEYLVRGPCPSVSALIKLSRGQRPLTQIYDFRHNSYRHFKFIERWSCKIMGIKYNRLPYSSLYGNYPDLGAFQTVAASVRQNGINGGCTLFHCNSGRHRTAQFSAFYKLTRGAPLATVRAALASKYPERVAEIIRDQVIDRNYFDRKLIDYKGVNPIKKLRVAWNNTVVFSTHTAHLRFMSRLGM